MRERAPNGCWRFRPRKATRATHPSNEALMRSPHLLGALPPVGPRPSRPGGSAGSTSASASAPGSRLQAARSRAEGGRSSAAGATFARLVGSCEWVRQASVGLGRGLGWPPRADAAAAALGPRGGPRA